MTSLAARGLAANTTSIREGYVSSPRRSIYNASVNLSVKVLDLSVWWPQLSQNRNR